MKLIWVESRKVAAWIGVCWFAIAIAAPREVAGSDTARSLQLAVYRLNDWLALSDNAEGWRRYLDLNVLESEMARGDQADVGRLDRLIERFRQSAAGLDHSCFVDVRVALERHRAHLLAAQGIDLDASLADTDKLFHTISAAELDGARQEAVEALQSLERVYSQDVDSALRADVLSLIEVPVLVESLNGLDFEQILSATYETEAAQQAARRELLRTLFAPIDSFDRYTYQMSDPWFVTAQEAYDRFYRAVYYATEPNLANAVAQQFATLKEHLPKLSQDDPRRSAALVGAVLGVLESSFQAPEVVTAIRQRYSAPNAYLRVSDGLLRGLAEREQADTRPVEEVILGRLILGCADTNARVSVDLIDDPHQVSASIHLRGQIDSNNYTRQGPITAFSGSHGEFEARRHIYGSLGGFYEMAPYVAANLNSQYRGVDCRLRVVDRLAQKQYYRDKELSEGIAAGRAEKRILDEFTEQTDTALAEAKDRVGQSISNVYFNSRWLPLAFLSSRPDGIHGQVQRSDMYHLAAGRPATFDWLGADVELLIHESLLTNYADPVVVGRTFTNTELAQRAEELFGKMPAAFQQAPGEEPWSITFPTTSAVQIEFEDNRVRLAITGRQFSQGNNSIRGSLVIRATFKMVRDGNRLLLMREGDVSVDYLDPTQVNARLSAFRSFLEGKLNLPVVPGDLPADAVLELPPDMIPLERLGAAPTGADIAGRLKLVQFRAEDGWLGAGWRLAPSANWSAAGELDLPGIHGGAPPEPGPDLNPPAQSDGN